MLPAKDWVTHYGKGVIREYCRPLDDYVVFTSPSAWRAVEPLMNQPPRSVVYVENQEMTYSKRLLSEAPRVEYVVGVGGGKAIDAAKFVADGMGAKMIFIPTIVSTGALFQAPYPAREDGKINILQLSGVPECLLFDTDVIRSAPPHLNASGMGECVCWLAQVAAWRWWCDRGLPGKPWEQAAVDEAVEWVHDRVDRYTRDLDADGRPGEGAIRTSAEINRERYELRMYTMQVGHSIDHLFDCTFLWVHDRDMLHSEAVALGTLMSCHLSGCRFEEARSLLDRCGTRYLPSQIGCTWSEIRSTLEAIPTHADQGDMGRTILHEQPIDDQAFAEMADRIEPGGEGG